MTKGIKHFIEDISKKITMILGAIISNYILIIFFLKSFYILYFIAISILAYCLYKFKYENNIYYRFLYALIILFIPFLFGLVDEYVYDFYLYLDLDFIYISINGLVAYILSTIHTIVFFFITFKKNQNI